MDKNLVLTKAKGAVLSHDFTTAARLYKMLLAEDASNVDYLKQLGSIYVQNQEDEKAIPYYEQIITFYPHYVEAMNSLGAIYRRLKRYQESIDILQRAVDEGRDVASVNYNLGFTYKEMGNYDDAIDAFQLVIHENPDDVLAYNHLGSIYFAQKNYDKSIAAYKRGLQIDQNHPILNYNLARCYEAAENPADAIRCYQSALKTRPGWVDAINDFSELLIKSQKNKEAQDLVQQSIKLHPTNADLLCLLGKVYLNQYDYSSAEKTFKKADSYKQNDVKILTGLAEALEKGEKVDAALDTVLSAMEIDPENKDIRKQYVHTLLTAKDYDAALSNIQELYEETDAKDLQVLDLYGQYYICKNDETEAKKYYEKIKKLNHHYKEYILSAANRYNQIGNYSDAEKYANEYIEKRPHNPEGYNVLGHIFEQKGDLQKAIQTFNKSLSLRQPNILANNKIQKATERLATMEVPVTVIEESSEPAPVQEEVIPQEETPVENNSPEEFDFSQMGGNVPLQEGLVEDEQDFFDSMDEDENISLGNEAPVSEEKQDEEPQKFEFNPTDPSDIFDDGIFDDEAADEANGSLENELKNDESEYAKEQEAEEEPSEDLSLDEPFDFGEIPEPEETVAPPPAEEPKYALAKDPEVEEMERRLQKMTIDNAAHAMDAAIAAQQMAQQLAVQQEMLKQQTEKALQEALEKVQTLQEEKIRKQEDELVSLLDDENIVDETVEEETFEVEDETPAEEEPSPEEETPAGEEEFSAVGEDSLEEPSPEEETPPEAPVYEDFLFPTVDEILQELGEATEEETAAEEEFFEAGEESPEVEETPAAEEEATETGEVSPDHMLEKIERILNDDSLAAEYSAELELFKKLKILGDFLPESEKNSFLSCRMRIVIEYVISKMSGKPGLLETATALLKSGVLGDEYNDRLEDDNDRYSEVTNDLIRNVLTSMKTMSNDLDDKTLVEAMCATVDNILERIELEDQKSRIF